MPNKWFCRKCFWARKMTLIEWLLFGNVLTSAYKSTLKSTLITIQYEDPIGPIETIDDMAKSGLPLLIPNNLRMHLADDPRQTVKEIYNRSVSLKLVSNGALKRDGLYM